MGAAATALWNPDSALLAPSPSLLPVNRELPSLLNLRVVSRALSPGPDVLSAGGNNLLTLRRRIAHAPPPSVVVELIPDHVDALLGFDRWLATEFPHSRLLVVGGGLKHWREYLLRAARHLTLLPAGNPVHTLVGLTDEQACDYLAPSDAELRRQSAWEKRRLAPAFGCPAGCLLCPRRDDEGEATRLRPVEAVFDEIVMKLRLFGVRDVDMIGAAWASDLAWATRFLEGRIRSELELRLQLVLTVQQLNTALVKLLVPGGCTRLAIRAGYDVPAFESGLPNAFQDLSTRATVALVCPVRACEESPVEAAARVLTLQKATHAQDVHVLLHTPADLPPACSELGRLPDVAPMEIHFGRTQRSDPAVRAWAEAFRMALVP